MDLFTQLVERRLYGQKSTAAHACLLAAKIQASIDARGIGRALDNVFRERLSRSVKSKNMSLNQYDLARHLQTSLTAYFDLYSHERPHPPKCTLSFPFRGPDIGTHHTRPKHSHPKTAHHSTTIRSAASTANDSCHHPKNGRLSSMKLQLFRDHLAHELRNLPDIRSQEIQSYALTTAVLLRYITQELGIEDLRVPAPYHPNEKSHPLGTILNSIVHYQAFYPPIGSHGLEVSEYFFYLYSSKGIRKGNRFLIRLNDYFDLVRRIADDDLLIANYLIRKTIRSLKKSIYSQTTLEPEFLQKVSYLVQDALALGLRLGKDKVIEIPDDVHVDYCEASLLDGTQWDFVYDYSGKLNSADFFIGFGSKWLIAWAPRKEQIGGAQLLCFQITIIDDQDMSFPRKLFVVPADSFVRMFEELHCRCKDAFNASL